MVEPGQIAAVRTRITRANEQRARSEALMEASQADEQRLLAEARDKYGLADLAAITAFVAAEDAAIALDLEEKNAALDAAAQAAAAVPNG